jgi:hypothetical protein
MKCARCGKEQDWVGGRHLSEGYGRYAGSAIVHEDPECIHDDVDWKPIEFDYQTDGTAIVWQEGHCNGFRALVQTHYTSEDPLVVYEGDMALLRKTS